MTKRNRNPHRPANSQQVPNPTIPDVTIEVDGRSFRLCFDFRALAIAKAKLKAAGIDFHVLRSIDFQQVDVDTLPALFFAAANKHQPDLGWEEAEGLVNIRTAIGILAGLATAYTGAMAPPDTNPPEATAKL